MISQFCSKVTAELTPNQPNSILQAKQSGIYSITINTATDTKLFLEFDFFEVLPDQNARYLVQISKKTEPSHTESHLKIYLKNDIWSTESWAMNHPKFSLQVIPTASELSAKSTIKIYIKVNDFGQHYYGYDLSEFNFTVKPTIITDSTNYCPNECNQNGNCVSSSCQCNKDFIGIDCNIRCNYIYLHTGEPLKTMAYNIDPDSYLFFKTLNFLEWSLLEFNFKVDKIPSDLKTDINLFGISSDSQVTSIPFDDEYKITHPVKQDYTNITQNTNNNSTDSNSYYIYSFHSESLSIRQIDIMYGYTSMEEPQVDSSITEDEKSVVINNNLIMILSISFGSILICTILVVVGCIIRRRNNKRNKIKGIKDVNQIMNDLESDLQQRPGTQNWQTMNFMINKDTNTAGTTYLDNLSVSKLKGSPRRKKRNQANTFNEINLEKASPRRKKPNHQPNTFNEIDQKSVLDQYTKNKMKSPFKTLDVACVKKYMPIRNYKSKDNIFSMNMCSICLGEFEEGDSIRKIEVCSHIFHPRCLLCWLIKDESCPMCKASLAKSDLIHHKI